MNARLPALLLCVACSTSPMGPADAGSGDGSFDVGPSDAPTDARDAFLAPFDGGEMPDAPIDAPERLGAPYPIVMAHGFFGFEDFAGAGFLDYFYGVKDDLAGRGETLVFTEAVDPFNDSIERGEQLLAHIERILAETGHAKVNLIGHSQGGIDARYVASVRPDLVASVTTVATPHQGTALLDFVLRALDNTALAGFIDGLIRLIGAPLYDAIGEETSLFDSFRQLSASGSDAFNEAYPNDPAVAYHSIGGRSGNTFALRECRPDGDAPEFITRWNRTLDPIDPLLAISETLFDGTFLDPQPNDGLVSVESSRWGRFLGCIPADHLDQVGQLLGDRPGLFNQWNYLDFYAELIAWLRVEGF